MPNDVGMGLGVLAAGALKVLGARAQAKKAERLREEERNSKLQETASARLYEMAREGNQKAAALLDVQGGYAVDPDQPGFGALARPRVSLGELDRSRMLSPTDARLSNLKQGEDFRNFESRVAPQSLERSSSRFIGPFQVGAEMSRRKIEEEKVAKEAILQKAYDQQERQSIDEAYKGVDDLAQKGLLSSEEYKKVLKGRQDWLKTGNKESIYMPESVAKAESAAELRRMDQAERNKNSALNMLARSYDFNSSKIAELQRAKESAQENWDKTEKDLREKNVDGGQIETLKHRLLYKKWDEIDKQAKVLQDRQTGLLEREAKLLGEEPGKMAGKPEPPVDPEKIIQKRAEDFQLQVYNTYLSGLENTFRELEEKNRPNLEGWYDKNFGYDPVENDTQELRDFVQGTLGLESYDVRKPEAIYQAMKKKALEKMQRDFAQAYPELAPKTPEKKAVLPELDAAIARYLRAATKKEPPEGYAETFLRKNPNATTQQLIAEAERLENAGK